MLGEPAFGAAVPGGDSEREALLAQQRIATVPAADGPYRIILREMADEAAVGIQIERAMKSAVEIVAVAKHFKRSAPHPGHDSHVERDIDTIGDFEADFGKRRADRTHHVRDYVHRAAAHRIFEPAAQLGVGFIRRRPIIGWAGVLAVGSAYEGQLFRAGDIIGVGAMQVAAGAFGLVEFFQHTSRDRFGGEAGLFLRRAIAPHNSIGCGKAGALPDPGEQRAIGC
jgi:hypothetical protein